MNDNLTHFLTALSAYKGENVFNPWRDTDTDYEVGRAVSIRQEQLMDYLTRRIGRAKILLIAEACGYQGGQLFRHRHDLRAYALEPASQSHEPDDPWP